MLPMGSSFAKRSVVLLGGSDGRGPSSSLLFTGVFLAPLLGCGGGGGVAVSLVTSLLSSISLLP